MSSEALRELCLALAGSERSSHASIAAVLIIKNLQQWKQIHVRILTTIGSGYHENRPKEDLDKLVVDARNACRIAEAWQLFSEEPEAFADFVGEVMDGKTEGLRELEDLASFYGRHIDKWSDRAKAKAD